VRRKSFGRDFGLSIRMALALLPILALYALAASIAFWILAAALADGDVTALLWWFFFAACFGVILFFHVLRGDGLALRIAGARELEQRQEEGLQELVRRMATTADLPPPRVALARSRAPNAFAVGLRREGAVIAVTTELLRRLDSRELAAVVAHELAHIVNRDGAVMTFVSGPSLLGDLMRKDDSRGWVFFYLFYWPVYVLGLLLMWAISRYREYTADRGAALITGAPEDLMSALTKIAGREPRGDLRGGAAISALCIVPAQRKKGRLDFLRRFEVFVDHPPLEKRLRRLEEIARDLGRPAR
jgi:heat shock protein HtpX